MSMKATKLGLERTSLLSNPNSNELLYHVRLVENSKDFKAKDLVFEEIVDTDDCAIFYQGRPITTTSTNELTMLMEAMNFKSMRLVEVVANGETYYAAVPKELIYKSYVGVLTDTKGRPDIFVQRIGKKFFADAGTRLIYLEFDTEEELVMCKPSDAIKQLNRIKDFGSEPCQVVLFK